MKKINCPHKNKINKINIYDIEETSINQSIIESFIYVKLRLKSYIFITRLSHPNAT